MASRSIFRIGRRLNGCLSSTRSAAYTTAEFPLAQTACRITDVQFKRFYSANPEPSSLGLRRQQLPPFPNIESNLDYKTLLTETFKAVQYGDHKYKECADGFVYIYVHANQDRFAQDTQSSYVVVYGDNHPMNHGGAVERRQELNHAKIYGLLQALKAIPENTFKKVCICFNETRPIHFIAQGLQQLSENSYRGSKTGRLINDVETCTELNKLLRTRTDLTLRMRYIPTTIHYDEAYTAERWAERLADQMTRAKRLQKTMNLIELDLER